MYTNDRNAYRQAFIDAWHKHRHAAPLEALEKEMVAAIIDHPEYHAFLEGKDTDANFELEENPFMHLSLHMSIRDQIKMDRPVGVRQIYTDLLTQWQQPLAVEHEMMIVLAQQLWQAQKTGEPPSNDEYLNSLKALLAN